MLQVPVPESPVVRLRSVETGVAAMSIARRWTRVPQTGRCPGRSGLARLADEVGRVVPNAADAIGLCAATGCCAQSFLSRLGTSEALPPIHQLAFSRRTSLFHEQISDDRFLRILAINEYGECLTDPEGKHLLRLMHWAPINELSLGVTIGVLE